MSRGGGGGGGARGFVSHRHRFCINRSALTFLPLGSPLPPESRPVHRPTTAAFKASLKLSSEPDFDELGSLGAALRGDGDEFGQSSSKSCLVIGGGGVAIAAAIVGGGGGVGDGGGVGFILGVVVVVVVVVGAVDVVASAAVASSRTC